MTYPLLRLIRLARRADHAKPVAAFLAVALLAAGGRVALADADAAAAGRAVQRHVGDSHRHLLGEPAPLRVAAARPDVAIDAVDAFDDDAILVVQHAQHPA